MIPVLSLFFQRQISPIAIPRLPQVGLATVYSLSALLLSLATVNCSREGRGIDGPTRYLRYYRRDQREKTSCGMGNMLHRRCISQPINSFKFPFLSRTFHEILHVHFQTPLQSLISFPPLKQSNVGILVQAGFLDSG